MNLEETITSIRQPDREAMRRCQARWDTVAKPLHSLGKLEDLLVQIAGVQRSEKIEIDRRALVIMCADNGVVEEGVTQTGQEVTAIVAENFLDVNSSAAIMCRETGTTICPIDIGMAVDTPRVEKHKIAYGTKNFTKEPAMTRQQAIKAIEVGIHKAEELKKDGYRVLATGEMGIGNTTSSSAITSVLLQKDPNEVTGRGAGLSSEGLERKIRAIRRGIAWNRPDPCDPLDILAKVGGFDIAGLAGVYLGGAALGMPVVVDGFISAVAALLAVRIAPACTYSVIASHISAEPATKMVMNALGKSPIIYGDMCLGEGTGAVALFPLLDLAAAVYHKMSTFEDIQVEQYEELK